MTGLLAKLEREAIVQTLAACKDEPASVTLAPLVLGIGKTTLYRKIKELQITEQELSDAQPCDPHGRRIETQTPATGL